jgi:hypothetical protein
MQSTEDGSETLRGKGKVRGGRNGRGRLHVDMPDGHMRARTISHARICICLRARWSVLLHQIRSGQMRSPAGPTRRRRLTTRGHVLYYVLFVESYYYMDENDIPLPAHARLRAVCSLVDSSTATGRMCVFRFRLAEAYCC